MALRLKYGGRTAFAETMLATYRDFQRVHHDSLIRPFPGVAEMLDALARDGHDRGLVTSKMEGFARRVPRRTGAAP